MKPKPRMSQGDQKSSGFTLTELLVVLTVLTLLAGTALTALARIQPSSRSALCRHNLKQLITAWQMYPEEYNAKIVKNMHGSASMGGPPAVSWASGWLDWSVSSDNTNVLRLIDSRYALLAPYVRGDSNLYKCPADQYLSPTQRSRGWTQRVRSYSANIYIGEGNANQGPSNPLYKQIRKISEFLYPPPSEACVYLDEHPDSLNDPAFFPPNQGSWVDLPATYHNGAANLAFGDGHTESRKWRGSLATGPATRVSYTVGIPPATTGDEDISWLSYHTPRVSSQSY
jgi:prepilin-type N-terminal cleavage/methylation domain-containing protein/prepilin-type processing-associated H-X9-DG protein